MAPERILRLPEVKTKTGLSKSTIYLFMSQGIFPTPISLGIRAVGWVESQVNQWIDERIKSHKKGTA